MKPGLWTCFLQSVLLSILATSGLAQKASETVRFSQKKLEAGDVISTTRFHSNELVRTIKLPDSSPVVRQASSLKVMKVFTVATVDRVGVTEAKLQFQTYDRKSEISRQGRTRETTEDSPLMGKTFLLRVEDRTLKAKHANGQKVTPEEFQSLKKELKKELANGYLVDPHQRMDLVIGEREMAVGETITIDRITGNKLFGTEDSESRMESVVLTLKGKRMEHGVECAVFDIQLNIDNTPLKSMGLKMKTDIRGELIFGITNMWAYKIEVAGPFSGKGVVPMPQGDAQIEIKGKVAMSAMATIVAKN